MKYLILAEICKVLGVAKWAVNLCYIIFGINVVDFILSICVGVLKHKLEKEV